MLRECISINYGKNAFIVDSAFSSPNIIEWSINSLWWVVFTLIIFHRFLFNKTNHNYNILTFRKHYMLLHKCSIRTLNGVHILLLFFTYPVDFAHSNVSFITARTLWSLYTNVHVSDSLGIVAHSSMLVHHKMMLSLGLVHIFAFSLLNVFASAGRLRVATTNRRWICSRGCSTSPQPLAGPSAFSVPINPRGHEKYVFAHRHPQSGKIRLRGDR